MKPKKLTGTGEAERRLLCPTIEQGYAQFDSPTSVSYVFPEKVANSAVGAKNFKDDVTSVRKSTQE
jgi:hypothetical protein